LDKIYRNGRAEIYILRIMLGRVGEGGWNRQRELPGFASIIKHRWIQLALNVSSQGTQWAERTILMESK
jgi:hypothetical protein